MDVQRYYSLIAYDPTALLMYLSTQHKGVNTTWSKTFRTNALLTIGRHGQTTVP